MSYLKFVFQELINLYDILISFAIFRIVLKIIALKCKEKKCDVCENCNLCKK